MHQKRLSAGKERFLDDLHGIHGEAHIRNPGLHRGKALLIQTVAAHHRIRRGDVLSGAKTHQFHCDPFIVVIRGNSHEGVVHIAVRRRCKRFLCAADVDRGRLFDDIGGKIRILHAGAYAKLDSLSKNVLYPDSWEPYSFEDVDFAGGEEGGTLWEAYRAIRKHEHKKAVASASGPYDKTVWDGFPFVVNCGYEPAVNGIYIYAAFARGNNYYPGMSDEELYAKIGTGIAHEISHAFDAEGSKYDKDGNMNNWWTEEDRVAIW